jgi:hypothetical protein
MPQISMLVFDLIPSAAAWVDQVMTGVDYMIFHPTDTSVDETLCANWRERPYPGSLE